MPNVWRRCSVDLHYCVTPVLTHECDSVLRDGNGEILEKSPKICVLEHSQGF
jgi:hypothetical protein